MRPLLPTIADDRIPVRSVLGDEARGPLGAVLGAAGGEVLAAVPLQATYHPGRSLTVRHDVTVRWGDGGTTDESIVLQAGAAIPPEALVLEGDGHRITAWRVPHDPHLPGLARVLDRRQARMLLREVGVGVRSATPRLVAYRPGRRAVVEITANDGTRVFAKVVRPDDAEQLDARLRLLVDHVPVPRPLGWSPDLGVVVLQAVPGETMRAALAHGRPTPDAGALLGLLEALPAPRGDVRSGEAAGTGHDVAPHWRARTFARLIGSVAPSLAGRVDALAEGLRPFESAAAATPIVAVHGDFHEAQVMVRRGVVSGILDVDTFGPGRRVDDLAAAVGHLSTLALGSPRASEVRSCARALLDGFDRSCDPALLRAAVAGVVLGLATGPFRVLEAEWAARTEQRVTLAEQWLASAQQAAESRSVGGEACGRSADPAAETCLIGSSWPRHLEASS